MPTSDPSMRLLAGLAALTCLAACAPPPAAPPVVAPAIDAEQLALSLEDRTALDRPAMVVFSWQLNEAGVRVKGRGVARIEPPYKARLDLFLGGGQTVVRAALVDGDLRLPPGTPEGILPPADLLWGVMGVFRPQSGSELLGADRLEDGALQLRYHYPDGAEVYFQLEDGDVHSLAVEHQGHVVQRVELEMQDGSRYPVSATYRDLTAFRELKLTRESVELVESYPPKTWDPNTRGVGR